MNKRKIFQRILAIPFIFVIILIVYLFGAFKQTWMVLLYGGEWITYYDKEDHTTIKDIYSELKSQNK